MKCETYLLQNLAELRAFIDLLRRERVQSYLEIGCKFGGSLWRVALSLPKNSRVVAVDLPHGDQSFKDTLPHLQLCIKELQRRDFDAHLIVGDSTAPEVVAKARELGPFDACFVDANHTEPYVRKDFENYRGMTKLIAFHDIGFFRQHGMPPGKKPIEVPGVWKEIKTGFRNLEIRHDAHDNGIGVLWL